MDRLSELGPGIAKIVGNVVPVQEALYLHPRFLALETHSLRYLRRLFIWWLNQRRLSFFWQFNTDIYSRLDTFGVHKAIDLHYSFLHLFFEVKV